MEKTSGNPWENQREALRKPAGTPEKASGNPWESQREPLRMPAGISEKASGKLRGKTSGNLRESQREPLEMPPGTLRKPPGRHGRQSVRAILLARVPYIYYARTRMRTRAFILLFVHKPMNSRAPGTQEFTSRRSRRRAVSCGGRPSAPSASGRMDASGHPAALAVEGL